ncbi:GGDEF domain-containing protein [Pseudomonas sp.]|jgi:diguanylate cyclase (GGDEF)-like protein|uniref:GGDEF domain-containing protein n=1 Tax=Pseudomonas sp. TaxID=306 RepID=UPI0028A641DF|nr:GGDEF domain-containing protein [Pseudomonas sp.]
MKTLPWQADLPTLRKLELLQDVSDDVLHSVSGDFELCELDVGEILLSPFNANAHLYLILDGQLKLYLGSLDNQSVISLLPGECAGEISMIDRQPPSAYVVAEGRCRLLRLPRQAVFGLLCRSPQAMERMLEMLCGRVRRGNSIILDTEQNANIDTLTGLFNRRWLEHVYERESTRCAFNEQELCMLMLDVDHFKAYNDKFGHLAGDYALCLVSHTLRNQLRPKDSMVRFGGEEFVILLPEMGRDEARGIGERLRHSLEQINTFYSPVGVLPGVTVSIGLGQMEAGDTLESLISRADAALYEAKQKGRNCLSG